MSQAVKHSKVTYSAPFVCCLGLIHLGRPSDTCQVLTVWLDTLCGFSRGMGEHFWAAGWM